MQLAERKDESGRREEQTHPVPLAGFVLLSRCLLSLLLCLSFFFSPLFFAPSLPAHYKKAARLCRRLELQNKSHLVRGECGDRGGERGRKRFPLSHRKRENRGEIARGIKAYCSLEGNCWEPIGGGEVEEGRERARRRKLKAGGIGLVLATIFPRAGKLAPGVIPQDAADDDDRCVSRSLRRKQMREEKREGTA